MDKTYVCEECWSVFVAGFAVEFEGEDDQDRICPTCGTMVEDLHVTEEGVVIE